MRCDCTFRCDTSAVLVVVPVRYQIYCERSTGSSSLQSLILREGRACCSGLAWNGGRGKGRRSLMTLNPELSNVLEQCRGGGESAWKAGMRARGFGGGIGR